MTPKLSLTTDIELHCVAGVDLTLNPDLLKFCYAWRLIWFIFR